MPCVLEEFAEDFDARSCPELIDRGWEHALA
jgi:hypothetical protein